MKIKLIEKKDEAKGTVSFFWQTETPVKWIPGQYFYYTISNLKYPDTRGTTRHFTISASPTEGPNLRLTTRIRDESGFKKSLNELPIGSEIEGEGPNGTFMLAGDEKGPQIFIAGGIGITPFRSIIKYVADKNLSLPVYLIYSNSVPEEIAFKSELEEIAKTHQNIKIAMTISHPEESQEPWTGLTGRVDDVMIKKLIADWGLTITDCTFWMSGPPAMVDAMEQVMGTLGILAGHVKSEKFTGY